MEAKELELAEQPAPSGPAQLVEWIRELSELFNQLNNFGDVSDLLGVIAEMAARLTNSEGAMVLLMDDAESMRSVATFGISSEYARIVTDPERLAHTAPHANLRAAWETGRPVLVPDIESDAALTHWVDIARKENIRSVGTFPMRSMGHSIGVINIYRRRPSQVDHLERTLISALADAATAGIRLSSWAIEKSEQVAELERVTTLKRLEDALSSALLEIVLAQGGIERIARLLQAELSGSLVIDDASDRLLSMVADPAEDGVLRRLILAYRSGKATVDEVDHVAGLREMRFGEVRSRSMFVREVRLGAVTVARIWALPSERESRMPVARVLDHGATAVALSLLGHTVHERDRHADMTDLCIKLADAVTAEDIELVTAQAAHIGIALTGKQFLAVAVPKVVTSELRVHGVIDAARRVLPDAGVLCGVVEQAVCTMVPDSLGMDGSYRDNAIGSLGRSLPAGWVLVVIGATSAAGLRRDLNLAKSLARSSGNMSGPAPVIDVRELGVLRLLYQVGDRESLTAVRDYTIGPLLAYDRDQGSNLVETLGSYLDCGMRLKDASDRLTIHVNTLRYRLRRIEEILKVELRSPRTLLNLEFGAQIHGMLEADSELNQ